MIFSISSWEKTHRNHRASILTFITCSTISFDTMEKMWYWTSSLIHNQHYKPTINITQYKRSNKLDCSVYSGEKTQWCMYIIMVQDYITDSLGITTSLMRTTSLLTMSLINTTNDRVSYNVTQGHILINSHVYFLKVW